MQAAGSANVHPTLADLMPRALTTIARAQLRSDGCKDVLDTMECVPAFLRNFTEVLEAAFETASSGDGQEGKQ